jgi:hydrogenase maturation protease
MKNSKARCLILACGNTLRADDGIGPWLAQWAEEHFKGEKELRIISRQQWAPELAADLSAAESALFIDCSVTAAPGSIHLEEVRPAASSQNLATHHLNAAELLKLSHELYDSLPRAALLMTVGADSTEMSEQFSPAVQAALPGACEQLRLAVRNLLKPSDQRK